MGTCFLRQQSYKIIQYNKVNKKLKPNGRMKCLIGEVKKICNIKRGNENEKRKEMDGINRGIGD